MNTYKSSKFQLFVRRTIDATDTCFITSIVLLKTAVISLDLNSFYPMITLNNSFGYGFRMSALQMW